MKSFEEIADKVIAGLLEHKVEAYIWHKATTGSVYIRFKDQRIGSLRIGDHKGRDKLKYKYNLRNDISSKHPKWVKDENVWRCYMRVDKWKDMVEELSRRAETVATWEKSKYNYTIPYFKQVHAT